VLVTGAGGSIGSEIGRQLLDMGAVVIALDHDETHLHDAMLAWPDSHRATPVLCDIRDESDLEMVFSEALPDVVFHTAALKHVPMLESYPVQAVKTNVFGTVNLLKASEMFDVSRFVLISTDKAVNPEGVLGSTKRVAEMLVQSAASTNGSRRFAVVRFGNVLGSRGSVVPTFMGQIRRGGPVTITDPEMTRYFMTLQEAVGLVLQAGALAAQGEVFVLDMGEPARIEDLAHRMIRLAGLVPGRDIDVVTTGPRPGEKTSEVLSNEPLRPSAHPKIRLAGPGYPGPAKMLEILESFDQDIRTGDIESLRRNLKEVCWQDWQPNETVDLAALEGFVS
ncbi:MAG TPA: UDP-N-acetylglucosamine 4,6-dehydratase family protein, partial [Acidimicrobiia bacterium]